MLNVANLELKKFLIRVISEGLSEYVALSYLASMKSARSERQRLRWEPASSIVQIWENLH